MTILWRTELKWSYCYNREGWATRQLTIVLLLIVALAPGWVSLLIQLAKAIK